MPISVSDIRSNPTEQIYHAVRVLGKSKDRLAVFRAIYKGKRKAKTVQDIADATGLSRIRVLQEAGRLADHHIVARIKLNGETAYEKDAFYNANKSAIERYALDRRKLKKLPTRYASNTVVTQTVQISLPRSAIRAKRLTIDRIDSFKRARSVLAPSEVSPMLEKQFKAGIAQILRERGKFQDWGGERNDLLTTRLVINGRRRTAAFGFKGPATRGKLTPAKMGKNADQIQRLFSSPAEVFLVQYHDQIDESVVEQMEYFAIARSVTMGEDVYYGIIDGQDTKRIIAAYPACFTANDSKEWRK